MFYLKRVLRFLRSEFDREVQELLGRQSVEPAMIYTHVVRIMSNRPPTARPIRFDGKRDWSGSLIRVY